MACCWVVTEDDDDSRGASALLSTSSSLDDDDDIACGELSVIFSSEDDDDEARRFWEELPCDPIAADGSTVADRLGHVGSLDQVVDHGWRQGCRPTDRLSRLKLLQANRE